jgi:phenylalanyl-tRNA synthetase alpha subunit
MSPTDRPSACRHCIGNVTDAGANGWHQQEDTYYLNETTVLRTHTTCHQTSLLKAGNRGYIAVGDVYRRDAIDATHYPVLMRRYVHNESMQVAKGLTVMPSV